MKLQAYSHVVPDYDLPGQVIVQGVVSLPDRDYFLRDGSGWFEYHGVSVRIHHDEGADCLEVAAYRTGHEDEDPIFQQFVSYGVDYEEEEEQE